MNIDKKQSAKLYNLNQDLKTVFQTYNISKDGIYPSGICHYIKDGYVLRTGEHYALITDKSISDIIDYDICIDSKKLYKFYSSYKKYVTNISLHDEDIIINTNGLDKSEYTNVIGYRCGDIQKSLFESLPLYNDDKDMIKNFKPNIILSEDEIINLVKNGNMFLKDAEFTTRITRELIPGLKKTHKVEVMFHHLPEGNMFRCIIKAERSTVTTFHLYKCLYV